MTRAEIEVKTKVYITYDETSSEYKEALEIFKKLHKKEDNDDYLLFLAGLIVMPKFKIEKRFGIEQMVIVADDFDLVDEMKVDE